MENLSIVLPYLQYVVDHPADFVGCILPIAIRVLNKDVHNEAEKYIVSIFVCLSAAMLLHFKELAVGDPSHFFASALLIITESTTVYNLYFKTSWINSKLNTMLKATPKGDDAVVTQEPSDSGDLAI